MHYFLYTVFFSVFAWLILTVHGRRWVLAVTLAGVIVVTLVVTPPQPARDNDPTINRGSDRGIDRLSKVLLLMALVLTHGRGCPVLIG